MSDLLVRRALEKYLAGMVGNLANTVYENEVKEPPVDATTPYQKCFLLPAEPDNHVQGSGVYRAHGVFQVSLLYPPGNGSSAVATQAELLRSRFRRGASISESGLSITITDTPAVGRGFEDGHRWHVPVSIRWQAFVTVLLPDADVQTWVDAVVANGGTVSSMTFDAVTEFVRAVKAAGVWTKINRMNLFCGDQLAAALVPLKRGGGNVTDTNVNFVAGDYSETIGLTGNGSTKYLRTGLVPSATLTLNDTHMAIYNRASASSVSNQLGAGGPMIFYAPHTGSQLISDQYNSTTGRVGPSVIGAPYGFLVASRNGAGEHVIYRNGIAQASAATSGGSLPTVECYVFAGNNFGSPVAVNDGARAGYSIGSGLSSADVAAYQAAMEAFQDALGRGVA